MTKTDLVLVQILKGRFDDSYGHKYTFFISASFSLIS